MLYITLRQYEYIAAIGREGSLSAAAERLNVSQPALSTALTRVEELLGFPLFVRNRGAAVLVTPQGRKFVAQAEALLSQASSIEGVEYSHQQGQEFRLGCFVDLAPFLLAPVLRRLREVMPSVSVYYRSDGFDALISALLKGQIDLALTYDLGMDAGFERQVVYEARPYALVEPRHALTRYSEVSLQQVSAYPLILSEEGLSVQHMLGLFRQQGLSPKIAHRAASVELLRSLAAHGEGVGLSYSSPPGRLSYDGQPLQVLPLTDNAAQESVVLARHGQGPADPVVAKATKTLLKLFESR